MARERRAPWANWAPMMLACVASTMATGAAAAAFPAAAGWSRPLPAYRVPSDSATLPLAEAGRVRLAVFGRTGLTVHDAASGAILNTAHTGNRTLTPETWRGLAAWQESTRDGVRILLWDGRGVIELATLRTPSPRVSIVETAEGVFAAWLELDERVPRLSIKLRAPEGEVTSLAVAEEFKTFSGPWLLPPGRPGERLRVAVLHGTASPATEVFDLDLFTVGDGAVARRVLGRAASRSVAPGPARVEVAPEREVLLFSTLERGRPMTAVLLSDGRVATAAFAPGRVYAVELDATGDIEAAWTVSQRRVIRWHRQQGPVTILSSPRGILERAFLPGREIALWRTVADTAGEDQLWYADRSHPYRPSLLERLAVALGLEPWSPAEAIATNAAGALALSIPLGLLLGVLVYPLATLWPARRPTTAALAGVAAASGVVTAIRVFAPLLDPGPLGSLIGQAAWPVILLGGGLGLTILALARHRLRLLDAGVASLAASAIQSLALVYPAVFMALARGLGD